MPNFPFQRAKALGYAIFENFPSAHANIIDANAAQAADGLVWTDVAAFKNWGAPQVTTDDNYAAYYNSVSDVWISVVVNTFASLPQPLAMLGASGVFTELAVTGGGATALTPRKRAADYNPTADVGLIGGLPGASSNKKYVRMATCFTSTMAGVTSSQTNANAVACLKWVPALGFWVAGHEGGGTVETSPDALTFTARATPNANARSSIAYSPSGSVVITSSVSTDKVIQSNNGVTWVERTMPSAKVWTNVVYVPLLGKFVAIGEGGSGMSAVATSVDGITWVDQPFVLPPNSGSFNSGQDTVAVAFGRTIYFVVSSSFVSGTMMLYSQDAGATWKFAAGFFPDTSAGVLVTNGRQLYYGDGTAIRMTIGAGF